MTECDSPFVKSFCHQNFLISEGNCQLLHEHVVFDSSSSYVRKQKFAFKIRVFNTEWANKYLATFTRYKFCAVCKYVIWHTPTIYSDLSNWW